MLVRCFACPWFVTCLPRRTIRKPFLTGTPPPFLLLYSLFFYQLYQLCSRMVFSVIWLDKKPSCFGGKPALFWEWSRVSTVTPECRRHRVKLFRVAAFLSDKWRISNRLFVQSCYARVFRISHVIKQRTGAGRRSYTFHIFFRFYSFRLRWAL